VWGGGGIQDMWCVYYHMMLGHNIMIGQKIRVWASCVSPSPHTHTHTKDQRHTSHIHSFLISSLSLFFSTWRVEDAGGGDGDVSVELGGEA
jgi:hypothetical protein